MSAVSHFLPRVPHSVTVRYRNTYLLFDEVGILITYIVQVAVDVTSEFFSLLILDFDGL